jgi:protein-S-isoprenylcysteine O-methyltransferase Ste14
MYDRISIILLVNFLNQLIMIEPVSSNDVTKTNNQIKGNEFRNFWGKASTIFIQFICFLNYTYYSHIPINISDYLCVSTIIIGAFLRLWAFKELGQYFTFSISIQKDHRLITTGPYGLFSHPGYVGQYMVNISTVLMCGLPSLITIGLMVYIFYRFYHRIVAEDKMLVDHFKSTYLDYKKSVLFF